MGSHHGSHLKWYSDGRLAYKANYVRGVKEKKYQVWSKSGKLEVTYV
jgi:antitoxin component YwqK of YwqJK toxin-antitoxin module